MFWYDWARIIRIIGLRIIILSQIRRVWTPYVITEVIFGIRSYTEDLQKVNGLLDAKAAVKIVSSEIEMSLPFDLSHQLFQASRSHGIFIHIYPIST